MTIHIIRITVEPPKGDAGTAVDNWVQNHNEWDNDPVSHSLVEIQAPEDGTIYVRGDYRFVQEETPTALLDDLEDRLQSIEGGLWYRLGYHECLHDEYDEDTAESGSWDETRENGTIPADIPTFA